MVKVSLIQTDGLEKTVREMYGDFQLENRIKNLSDMTIRYYEQNSIHFFRYLDRIKIELVEDIEKRTIDQFIMDLKRKRLKATTINTSMKKFSRRWVIKMGR